MRRGWLAGCLAAACSAAGAAQVEPAPCRVVGIEHAVRCGSVSRPLDPARPGGPTIEVHYLVVPALARNQRADPVFLLAGGPGQSAIDVAPQVMPLFSRLNNRRDIVFVDQRGTGRSAPLDCPDAAREPLAEQADSAVQIAALRRCETVLLKRSYLAAPADLGYFTTTLAMQDLDAVRAELGAAHIDLVGVSYGTRAALEYLRQFPGTVRRAVLDSVAPPDMILPASFSTDAQAAFDALLVACEQDPICARAYPRLRTDWSALLAGLPEAVTTPEPLSGRPETYPLSRSMVLAAVRGALYSPTVASALPAAITAAAAGRIEGLTGLGSLLDARRGQKLALGMHFSVICAEDAPRLAAATDRPGADFGNADADLYRQVCSFWPRGAVPPAFYRVPPTTTPTLLLAGGLDPATPPRHAARAAASLGARARLIVVPNAGHSVLGIGCAPELLTRFIDIEDADAALALDAGCLTAIPRPGVFLPIEPTASSRAAAVTAGRAAASATAASSLPPSATMSMSSNASPRTSTGTSPSASPSAAPATAPVASMAASRSASPAASATSAPR